MTTPFKLSAVQPHFWEWVEHEVRGDLGAKIPVKFKVKYRRPEQEEVVELINRLVAGAQVQAVAILHGGLTPKADAAAVAAKLPELTDQEVIEKYVLDWDTIVGDDDKPLPYNKKNMQRMEKLLGCRGAMVRTFLDTFMKAPEKNSGPRRGTSTK